MTTLSQDPGAVKFIYWDNLTYPPSSPMEPDLWDARAAMDLYDSYLAHAVAAEKLGYAGVSMPEHFVPSCFEAGHSPLDNPFLKASLNKPDEDYLSNPFMFVGPAATVRAKLDALLEAGFGRFITVAGGVGVQHDIGWASARALAEDVAPDLFSAAARTSAPAGATV